MKSQNTIINSVNKKIAILSEIKSNINSMDIQRKEIELEIIDLLDEVGLSTIDTDIEEGTVKATIVRAVSVKIDETGLRESLSDKQWQSISTRVLDEKLLEDKVARGLISIDLVANNSTEVQKKPYVKLTHGKKK